MFTATLGVPPILFIICAEKLSNTTITMLGLLVLSSLYTASDPPCFVLSLIRENSLLAWAAVIKRYWSFVFSSFTIELSRLKHGLMAAWFSF